MCDPPDEPLLTDPAPTGEAMLPETDNGEDGEGDPWQVEEAGDKVWALLMLPGLQTPNPSSLLISSVNHGTWKKKTWGAVSQS